MKSTEPLRYLIVEDSATMREWLKMTVRNQGANCVIDAVTSYFEALQRLRIKEYDIVICDYLLSDDRDGQQLLEECRKGKLIRSTVVWMMVTAERAYQQVISAVELAPDDYILKPLRPDALEQRLKQCFAKKQALRPLLELMDDEQFEQCVAMSVEIIRQPTSRYRLEVLRIQAEALFHLQRFSDAVSVYQGILSVKDNLPWAKLGLAKSNYFLEHIDEAEEILESLVKENPDYLQGHDWLAKVHQIKGRIGDASALLKAALQKNPKALDRVRETILAVRKQEGVEHTGALYDLLLKHGGGGSFIDPSDICHRAKFLAANKNTNELERFRNNVKSWYGNKAEFSHAVAATAMYGALAKGNAKEAKVHYEQMQQALADHPALNIEDKLAVFDAALAVNDKSTALLMAQEVVSGDQAGDDLHAMVRNALVSAGHQDDAKELEKEVEKVIAARNYNAVKLAKEGDMRGAAEEFISLADKNPKMTFILNAALAIAKLGHQNELDNRLNNKLNHYLEYAYNNARDNPKVRQLVTFSKQFLSKPEMRFKEYFFPVPEAPDTQIEISAHAGAGV